MIEIIPRPAQKLPLWQNLLFYFSIALLIGTILSFFILDHFQKKTLSAFGELETILSQGKTLEERALEAKVLNYQKKIEDFSQLIDQHVKTSSFFEILESICHPQIWFSALSLSAVESQVVVSGQTESFQALGQQLIIFQNDETILNVGLSDVYIGETGEVNFTFNLSLDSKVFH